MPPLPMPALLMPIFLPCSVGAHVPQAAAPGLFFFTPDAAARARLSSIPPVRVVQAIRALSGVKQRPKPEAQSAAGGGKAAGAAAGGLAFPQPDPGDVVAFVMEIVTASVRRTQALLSVR